MLYNRISDQELVHEGVLWLNSQREELIKNFIEILATMPVEHYYNLPQDYLRKIATSKLDGFSRYLEGVLLDNTYLKKCFTYQMQLGISLQDLINYSDQLHQSLIKKIHRDLATRPQLWQTLLREISHYIHLVQTSMIVAAVEYQTQQN